MDDIRASGKKFMSATAEAQRLIHEIAEPRPVGDSVKAAIVRAWRRINASVPGDQAWRYSRARAVWHADQRISVSGDELNHLRAAARVAEEEALDSELALLAARLAYAEERLARIDPEFHAPAVDGLRAQARAALASALRSGRIYRAGSPGEGDPQ